MIENRSHFRYVIDKLGISGKKYIKKGNEIFSWNYWQFLKTNCVTKIAHKNL